MKLNFTKAVKKVKIDARRCVSWSIKMPKIVFGRKPPWPPLPGRCPSTPMGAWAAPIPPAFGPSTQISRIIPALRPVNQRCAPRGLGLQMTGALPPLLFQETLCSRFRRSDLRGELFFLIFFIKTSTTSHCSTLCL